jgi:hypothetical protein
MLWSIFKTPPVGGIFILDAFNYNGTAELNEIASLIFTGV